MMDLVDRLKSSHSLLGDPLHREAWEEIENLRKLIRYKDANGAIDIVETNYISRLHHAEQEIERLRFALLRIANEMTYDPASGDIAAKIAYEALDKEDK